VTQTFCTVAHGLRAGFADGGQRYAHSVRVARLAELLARAHGEDTRRARFAGMLHDLARLYSAERLLRECADRHMTIDDFERDHPVVLHARLGAELARERYGVTDDAILSAIRTHTLGAPAMTRLDAVVYLADSLEPARDFPEREPYLRVAYDDLDEGMRLLLGSHAAYLRGRGLQPAPLTLAALERYTAPGTEGTPREAEPTEDPFCPT
jgi:predicted HD superfamily hydrolase involved in NAD metabolism